MRGRRVVVLISSDPRESGRAFEAMRIATGVVAGDHEVVLVLTGPAVRLLDDDTDALVDGDDVAKFRASLRRLGVPFHVAADAVPAGAGWNGEGHPVVPVTREQIAELVAGAARTLVF